MTLQKDLSYKIIGVQEMSSGTGISINISKRRPYKKFFNRLWANFSVIVVMLNYEEH